LSLGRISTVSMLIGTTVRPGLCQNEVRGLTYAHPERQ
jgi:hypothetical protein